MSTTDESDLKNCAGKHAGKHIGKHVGEHAGKRDGGGGARGGRRGRLAAGLIVVGVLAAVSGCTALPVDDAPPDTDRSEADAATDAVRSSGAREVGAYPVLGRNTDRPYDLVATDLMNALAQIGALTAPDAVIRVPPALTPFAEALESSLIDRLFAVERIAERTGKGVLMNSVVPVRPGIGAEGDLREFTFIVAIDRIAIKRTYRIGKRFVAPSSSLYVRGAEPAQIELDDRIFLEDEDSRG